MAQNLYEAVMTRNSELARFFDENHNAALMVKKLIGMIVRLAEEQRTSAPDLKFEVYVPRGTDEVIIIKLKK